MEARPNTKGNLSPPLSSSTLEEHPPKHTHVWDLDVLELIIMQHGQGADHGAAPPAVIGWRMTNHPGDG